VPIYETARSHVPEADGVVLHCYPCIKSQEVQGVHIFNPRDLKSEVFTLTEVFPCFFLSFKANARVKLAKTGHGPHFPIVVLFYVLIDLYRSMYCLCVNVYCTSATG
jgi:hypothetical protein